ncbi:WXG100 family type VII secretion target [Solirubrobacter sp. CPCC 204708]|uniref:WXG100 family type VII secretion target n=1 Tax=Solirubrobacter deserti TaxID=2282478 RepID=A0ABT4RI23_9ACTN|nr:WXG100 family type VII secretion target [Solirubrobacter deserti]MBE2318823.1 WXG100 family type VII secretion target [Solirubrobacter deserti]MDA0138203.1 WXG100 family type VII secretion target [Solirubrobacter deserti]
MHPLAPVPGDPAAIRAFAARVRSQARQVSTVEADVRGAVDCMTFQGPAATEFRAGAGSWRGSARSVAAELESIATRLEGIARKVEHDQRERERKLERMRRMDADERRREAQRNKL